MDAVPGGLVRGGGATVAVGRATFGYARDEASYRIAPAEGHVIEYNEGVLQALEDLYE